MGTSGDGKGSVKVDNKQVSTGGEITVSAPPGSTLVVHEEGTTKDTEITADDKGRAKLPAGNTARDLVVYLKSNPSMWASLSVIELFR